MTQTSILDLAERLLWLVENCTRFEIYPIIGDIMFIEIVIKGERYSFVKGTKIEAIKAAYEQAKQEGKL